MSHAPCVQVAFVKELMTGGCQISKLDACTAEERDIVKDYLAKSTTERAAALAEATAPIIAAKKELKKIEKEMEKLEEREEAAEEELEAAKAKYGKKIKLMKLVDSSPQTM